MGASAPVCYLRNAAGLLTMLSTEIGALFIRFILMIVLSAYIAAYREELAEYRECKSDCNDKYADDLSAVDCDEKCDNEIAGYFKDNVSLRQNVGWLIFGVVVTVIYLVVSTIAIAVGICGFQAEDAHPADEELGRERPNPAQVSPNAPTTVRVVHSGAVVAGTVIPSQPIVVEANVISVTSPQQQQQQSGAVHVVVQEPRSSEPSAPVASEVHIQRSKLSNL